MRIDLSSAQLEALEAARRGELSRTDERFEHWRLATGLAVTPTARTLLAKELIREGVPVDGLIHAVVTDRGRAVLEELAGRGPATDGGD